MTYLSDDVQAPASSLEIRCRSYAARADRRIAEASRLGTDDPEHKDLLLEAHHVLGLALTEVQQSNGRLNWQADLATKLGDVCSQLGLVHDAQAYYDSAKALSGYSLTRHGKLRLKRRRLKVHPAH